MTQVIDTLEATAVTVANKATWTGSAVTVVGGLTASDIGIWAGIVIGLVGLIVNAFYKNKADRRATEAHRLYLTQLVQDAQLKGGFHSHGPGCPLVKVEDSE